MEPACPIDQRFPICCQPEAGSKEAHQWLKLGMATLVAGQSMAFGIAVNISPPEDEARVVVHGILALSAMVVFLLVGWPLLVRSLRSLLSGKIALEQLFMTGVLGAFGASVHSSLTGQGDVYYEVVAVLLAIYTFGSLLGQGKRTAALEAASSLKTAFSKCLLLRPDGKVEEVNVSDLNGGDKVIIPRGENITVDGAIIEGTGFVRELALTGEPFPVVKRVGDRVLAGSICIDQRLVVETVSSGNRELDRVIDKVELASVSVSETQREADRLVTWFLPVVLGISIFTFIGWTAYAGWVVGMFNSLAVLVVACPCAMGLATPIGIWNTLNFLASRGLVARSADFIEQLACIDTVVFDKTGTLSEEELVIADVITSHEIDRGRTISMLKALESSSSHPIAAAFRKWEIDHSSSFSLLVSDVEDIPGCGIKGLVDGVEVEVGNVDLVKDLSIDEMSCLRHQRVDGAGSEFSGFEIFFKINGKLSGLVILQEKLRDDAHEVLDVFRSAGLKVEVMTGDREENVRTLGLPATHTGLLPEDKVRLVKDLKDKGRSVLFVGDGINDSAVITEADASIALNSGSGLTREAAMAELYGSRLRTVAEAVSVCRDTILSIRKNLYFAGVYNFIGIGLAASGVLHPVMAAMLMMVSSIIVTWRAMQGSVMKTVEAQEFSSFQLDQENTVRTSQRSWFSSLSWSGAWCGLALAIQGPVLSYSAQLDLMGWIALSALTVALSLGLAVYVSRVSTPTPVRMGLAMISIANLGMLLGWLADAGFKPLVSDGVCLCSCPMSVIGWGMFLSLNWTHGGMLLLSIPAMWFLAPKGLGLLRCSSLWKFLHLFVGMLGMLLGMDLAAVFMGEVIVVEPQQQLMLNFISMTLGMLIGMFIACSLFGRVLSSYLKRSTLIESSGQQVNPASRVA